MKRNIGRKFLAGLIIFTLVLAGSICLIASRQFELRTIERYEDLGLSLPNCVAALVDGNKIEHYLETGKPDEYYQEMVDQLSLIRDAFDPKYMYIIVPGDQHIRYIWANDFTTDDMIGLEEDYAPGEKEWLEAKLHGEESNILFMTEDNVYGRLATAASPIFNSQEQPVALAVVDFSIPKINDAIRKLTLSVSVYTILLMSACIVIYYMFVNRNLVRPIQRLTGAAENLTRNLEQNIVYHSDIHTGDELETLSKSFEKMDASLRSYIEDNLRISAERQRMNTELELASSIQNGQLPSKFPAFPERTEFDIYASMTPARSVGGDFYDFFLTDDDHLALIIADVSGHGVPGALFMMITRILIKNHLQAGESPAQALSSVNRQLLENNQARLFVTVWLSLVDLNTGRGVAVNAGHMHPALRRSGGQYELVQYRHDPPVGILKKAEYTEHGFELHPGDSLFVYTDGVTEAVDREETLFGTDRMLAQLNREPGAGCAETLENVMNDIRAFADGTEQADDITMLCFHYYGSANERIEREG